MHDKTTFGFFALTIKLMPAVIPLLPFSSGPVGRRRRRTWEDIKLNVPFFLISGAFSSTSCILQRPAVLQYNRGWWSPGTSVLVVCLTSARGLCSNGPFLTRHPKIFPPSTSSSRPMILSYTVAQIFGIILQTFCDINSLQSLNRGHCPNAGLLGYLSPRGCVTFAAIPSVPPSKILLTPPTATP